MSDNVCQGCGRALGAAVLPGHVTHATHAASHPHRFHVAVTRHVVAGWVPLIGPTRDHCVRLGLHLEWDPAAKVDRTDPVAFLRWEEWEDLARERPLCAAVGSLARAAREAAVYRIGEAARIVRDEGPIAWWLAWVLSGLPETPSVVRFAARVPGVVSVPKSYGDGLYPRPTPRKMAVPEIPGGVWDLRAHPPDGAPWLCERGETGPSRRRAVREGGWSPDMGLVCDV